MKGLIASCASLLIAAMPASASGQSAAEAITIQRWDDSLYAVKVAGELVPLQNGWRVPGQNAGLRRALYDVRKAELTGVVKDLQTAHDALLLESSRHSSWGWPLFALARSFVYLHTTGAKSGIWNAQRDGESLADAAWRNLAASLKVAPDFQPARELFLELMLAIGERELHDNQLLPLQLELKRPLPDNRALLVWGRVLRSQGKFDEALEYFTRAALAGGDYSRLALERAKAFRGLNDTLSSATAYWDGLDRPTPAGRANYRYDLGWILGPDSLTKFDAVPNDSLATWMHRFWDERDASAGHHFGERLQEHLWRWITAIQRYRIAFPWRKTSMDRVEMLFDGTIGCFGQDTTLYLREAGMEPQYAGDVRDRERLLDDRGIIYLRHGAPDRVLGGGVVDTIVEVGRQPIQRKMIDMMRNNTSWLYWFGDEWRLLHFRGSQALGMYAPTTLTSFLPIGNPNWYFDVDTDQLPEYEKAGGFMRNWIDMGPLPGELPRDYHQRATCETPMYAVVKKSRSDAETATTTDSDSPPLLNGWNGPVSMYAIGHDTERNGKALITFAIPANKLRRAIDGEYNPLWAIDARIIAYQVSTGKHFELDTLRTFKVQPVPEKNQFLAGWFEAPLTAGDWQITLRLRQGDDSLSGMFAINRRLTISNEPVLALSDIVLGSNDGTRWTAPDGIPFLVNALGTWKQNTDLNTYFEVRGVLRDASYATSIQVLENRENGKMLFDLKFSDISSGAFTPVRKSLSLEKLDPGSYILKVILTANGATVERRSGFNVVKP